MLKLVLLEYLRGIESINVTVNSPLSLSSSLIISESDFNALKYVLDKGSESLFLMRVSNNSKSLSGLFRE